MQLLVNVLTNQDTLAASCYSLRYCNNYMNGHYAPHYPVPAKRNLPTQVYLHWYDERVVKS